MVSGTDRELPCPAVLVATCQVQKIRLRLLISASDSNALKYVISLITFLLEDSVSRFVPCLGNALGLKLIREENSTHSRGLTADTGEKQDRERERERDVFGIPREKSRVLVRHCSPPISAEAAKTLLKSKHGKFPPFNF
jgi:hypothetical protein